MIGKPKYTYGDIVSFDIKENDKVYKLVGKIAVVDSHGTFMDNSDVSYDIMVDDGTYPIEYPCLFKHIKETGVTKLYV